MKRIKRLWKCKKNFLRKSDSIFGNAQLLIFHYYQIIFYIIIRHKKKTRGHAYTSTAYHCNIHVNDSETHRNRTYFENTSNALVGLNSNFKLNFTCKLVDVCLMF